jgi:hypothetical protein
MIIEDVVVNDSKLDLIIDKINLIGRLCPFNPLNEQRGITIEWRKSLIDGDYVVEFNIITPSGSVLFNTVHSSNDIEIQCFDMYLSAFIHGIEFAQRGVEIKFLE